MDIELKRLFDQMTKLDESPEPTWSYDSEDEDERCWKCNGPADQGRCMDDCEGEQLDEARELSPWAVQMAQDHPHIQSEQEFMSILNKIVVASMGQRYAVGLMNDEDFVPDMMGEYKAAGGKLTDPMYIREGSGVREVTIKLHEYMDEGMLDPRVVADAALTYMSEADVAEMARINELIWDDDDDDYDYE